LSGGGQRRGEGVHCLRRDPTAKYELFEYAGLGDVIDSTLRLTVTTVLEVTVTRDAPAGNMTVPSSATVNVTANADTVNIPGLMSALSFSTVDTPTSYAGTYDTLHYFRDARSNRSRGSFASSAVAIPWEHC
jgi:hypothetical protein